MFHCFIDALMKDQTLTVTSHISMHFCIQLCGTMQLTMMLTASYNSSLSFCQLVVDLLCLTFLSWIPFVPKVLNLFFQGVHLILELRCLLVNSRSMVGKWCGLKFDTKFSFMKSKVFPVTIHLGKLFSWRHLSN